jgi:tRNA threonylcarbamoyladenosine biosynthesis protein TsaE
LIPKANYPCNGADAPNSPPSGPEKQGNSVFITNSYEETFEFGMALGKILKKDSVVALKGPIGAGKTCLCAGICRALGVNEPVTSPTYTIIHEYEGAFPVYHIDAYRLSGPEDFENSGGGEALCGGGVCLVEWSERISACLPPDAINIEIKIAGAAKREIRLAGLGSKIEYPCH